MLLGQGNLVSKLKLKLRTFFHVRRNRKSYPIYLIKLYYCFSFFTYFLPNISTITETKTVLYTLVLVFLVLFIGNIGIKINTEC